MNIQYIEMLNDPLTDRKHAIVDINDIWLDEKNPRFASSLIRGKNKKISQNDIIEYMLNYANIEDLALKIVGYGGLYDEVSLSCYIDENGHLVVLEGNRRMTTCKVLLNHLLIPENLKDNISLPSASNELRQKISRVHVVIYDKSKDAQNYITAKHTKPEVKRWETFEQCNYYHMQFNTNKKSLMDISTASGDNVKDVKNKIKKYQMFNDVIIELQINNSNLPITGLSILPLVDKFLPRIYGKDSLIGMNLPFDDLSIIYKSKPHKTDVYKRILLMVGNAFFIRQPAKTNNEIMERSNSNLYCISTEEIRTKGQVKKLILDDIRIPGLLDLINQYNDKTKVDGSDNKDDENTDSPVDGIQDNSPGSEIGGAPNGGGNSNITGTNDTPNTGGTNTGGGANSKGNEFFSALFYAHISSDNVGLLRVCDELYKISTYYNNGAYKHFPISSAFLLRALLEQIFIKQLKIHNRYERLVKTKKDGSIRSPELGSMIEVFLKDYHSANLILFDNDAELAKNFNKCFDGWGTKDQLDTIIHNPHLIAPDKNFLNSFVNQGLGIIVQGFLDKFK